MTYQKRSHKKQAPPSEETTQAQRSVLAPGTTLFGRSRDGITVKLNLASLFSMKHNALSGKLDDTSVYALLGLSEDATKCASEVSTTPFFEKGDIVGSFIDDREFLPFPINKLFRVAKLSVDLAEKIKARFRPAAYSQNFYENLSNAGEIKIRIVRGAPTINDRGRPQKASLVGDIASPEIDLGAGTVVLDRAGLAMRGMVKPFGHSDDGGMPVVSSQHALMGFIVGQDGSETLILPAEHVATECNIDFLTPITPQVIRPNAALRKVALSPSQ